MQSEPARPHNPEAVRNTLFAKCKWWLGIALSLKAAVFVGGALTILLSVGSGFAPIVIGLVAAASELAMWRSDWVKGIAETLHRKLDLEDSFGWRITNADLRDLLARIDIDLSDLAEPTEANYFASKSPPSDQRALENLQESAWWSKHLAESMWKICLGAICALIVGCILLLLTSVHAVKDQAVLSEVGKVVTSAILLIFSLSLLRFTVGYFLFSKKAEKAEERAKTLVATSSVGNIEAIKLWQEYQLARASAPLVPTRIWKLREKRLNALWRDYRN
jgi:hypothetical protein